MRRSFLVRVPLEYRELLREEEKALGLQSQLDTMGHILSDYFARKQLQKAVTAVAKSETALVPAVTAHDTALETAPVATPAIEVTRPVTTPVTAATTKLVTDAPAPEKPKSLYGGRIYVA